MKKLLILIIGIVLLVKTSQIYAEWQRLRKADCLSLDKGEICVIWDELEQTNCYLFFKNENWFTDWGWGTSAISCIKK